MSPGIPDDVRGLLERSIRSVRQLDILLLMRDSGSDRDWTAGELNTVLRSSEDAVEADLYGLLAAGLVEATDGPPTRWRYHPGSHGQAVERLAGSYKTHRPAVIRLVVSTRPDRSLEQFADAFRLRGRNDTDG